ncbi:glycerophosphodiester phosphodiesterase [Kiritimatiellota bacterium B12222]|nr:glycerophosphodiester phosphodiesterase [Kiritimatiellota bacterium B12222]
MKRLSLLLAFLINPSSANAQLNIAHRGDAKHEIENTQAAVSSAWKQGADVVEIDVQMLVDRTLVLFHDSEIQGVSLSSLSYEQLQRLNPQISIPTLGEILQACPKGKTLLLDLKSPTPQYLNQLLSVIRSHSSQDLQYIFQSTHVPSLMYLRGELPENTPLFYVTSLDRSGPLQKQPDPIDLALKIKTADLNGITAKGRNFVNAAYVSAFHDQGLAYFVWTINDTERMRYYSSINVDGIITDDPKTLSQIKQDVINLRTNGPD